MKTKKPGGEKGAGASPISRKPKAVTTNKRERTPSPRTATKGAGSSPHSRKPKAVTTKKQERTPSPRTATRTGGPKREGAIAQHQPPTSEEVSAKISTLAYELYERRGWHHGQELSDWLDAERQVLAQEPFVTTLVH